MIRKTLFWTHLSIGVTAGAVILIMSITGVLLALERQVLQFVDRDVRSVTPVAGARTRSVAEMLAAVQGASGSAPSAVTIRPEASAAVEFTFGRGRSVYVDPYTGAVLGEGSKTARQFFGAVERWHRALGESLGSHGPLRSAAAAANLLFLMLVISGSCLWLPRKWTWQALRAGSIFRRELKGRARDWNWHNVTGLWCAVPLLLITLTGVIMSYPWANNLLFRMAGSPLPVRQDRGDAPNRHRGDRDGGARIMPDVDELLNRARGLTGDWRTISLRIPSPGDKNVTVSVDVGTGGEVEKRTSFVIDTRTAAVVRTMRFSDNSLGQRLRALVRFIHTGEEGGLSGQVIAALASTGAILLVWTGMSLALRRARNRFAGPPARRPGQYVWSSPASDATGDQIADCDVVVVSDSNVHS